MASDWSRVITWSVSWPLIGQRSGKWTPSILIWLGGDLHLIIVKSKSIPKSTGPVQSKYKKYQSTVWIGLWQARTSNIILGQPSTTTCNSNFHDPPWPFVPLNFYGLTLLTQSLFNIGKVKTVGIKEILFIHSLYVYEKYNGKKNHQLKIYDINIHSLSDPA